MKTFSDVCKRVKWLACRRYSQSMLKVKSISGEKCGLKTENFEMLDSV